jgi:hypothetical protein
MRLNQLGLLSTVRWTAAPEGSSVLSRSLFIVRVTTCGQPDYQEYAEPWKVKSGAAFKGLRNCVIQWGVLTVTARIICDVGRSENPWRDCG